MTAVLESAAPSLSSKDAEDLARVRFGIEARARLLTSERDQNFHLAVADGPQYVLKIANAAEDERVIAFQNEVLEHLAAVDPSLPAPRLVRTLAGEDRIMAGGSIVRLMSWLSGSLMHEVERSGRLRESLGRVHARLLRALESCSSRAPQQDLEWDLQRFPRLRPLLAHIGDESQRAMLERTLDDFDAQAAPQFSALRRQIIHNDLNPHNVVVDGDGLVCGVIDFGDMLCAPLICDVAVAGAYHVRAEGDPLAHVGEYVSAFHHETPLRAEEIDLIPLLIRARLAMTALITNWRASLYPGNRSYILRNAPAAWSGLAALGAAPGRLEIRT